jgi:hypothetical protein
MGKIGARMQGLRLAFYRVEKGEERPARWWGGGTQWPAMNGLVVEPFQERKRARRCVGTPAH